MKIQLWVPGLFDFKGGIQVFSGDLLKALQEILPEVSLSVFILHDRKRVVPSSSSSPKTKHYYSGHWPASIRNLAFSAQIVAAAAVSRPDLIITTHLNFTPVAKLLKDLLGVPFWAVAHGVEAWNIEKNTIKVALHSADRILSVSEYTRQRLIQAQQISFDKISIFPNTVNATAFTSGPKSPALLQKYGITAQQPVILTVCRLCASEVFKSYDVVLEALADIRCSIPTIHYLLVGKGDDASRVRQRVNELGLNNCVTLAGFVPDEALCEHYRLCDVFALPGKLEGFGIVYLEAMACGKPTLGSNQDGALDALDHGRLGPVVNPDDIKAISTALIDILKREHANTVLYEPQRLRAEMLALFSFDSFKRRLAVCLSQADELTEPLKRLS
ncbi:MAG: glycosyltransferase family 4 protein [Cyanobacteria bacterium P01_A01_bin.116]